MIIGTGIDVVNIDRFEKIIQKNPRLLERVFVAHEREKPLRSLAARFAAKEAVAKALRAPAGMVWQDCWIENTEDGAPYLVTTGTVAQVAASLGINRWHLSITHDEPVAIASVSAEHLNQQELAKLAKVDPAGFELAESDRLERLLADSKTWEGYRQDETEISWLTDNSLASLLAVPGPDDHKYSRGVLGIIAGSEHYPGAALMSCRAAVNAGAGMVRFFGSDRLNYQVQMSVPEAVCSLSGEEKPQLDVWAVGSGATGQSREQELIEAVQSPQPAIVDAAALNLAAQLVALEGPLGAHKILTPHAGELARIFEWISAINAQLWKQHSDREPPSREEIEAEPLHWVKTAATLTGATVLLKGSKSLISSPDGAVYGVEARTFWLSTAGSGDTLTGIMGSLLAQRLGGLGFPEPADLPADFYAQTAAGAVLVHNLAAFAVHEGASGPVPPTLVAQKIPAAIAQSLPH